MAGDRADSLCICQSLTRASRTLIRPFAVAIADSEIEDLKQRLARTRWPNPETVPDWSQGVRLENAKSLIG
jgi:hypothetical protein